MTKNAFSKGELHRPNRFFSSLSIISKLRPLLMLRVLQAPNESRTMPAVEFYYEKTN
jgi:hypothetical protein